MKEKKDLAMMDDSPMDVGLATEVALVSEENQTTKILHTLLLEVSAIRAILDKLTQPVKGRSANE